MRLHWSSISIWKSGKKCKSGLDEKRRPVEREREKEKERDIKMPTMTMPKSIKTQRHVVSLLPFAISNLHPL